MCKAKHYAEDLLIIYDNIIAEFNKLSNELSQADLYEQDILHTIENGNFNAADGYKLSKMLYDNRKKRREIKNELDPLGVLRNTFIDVNKEALNATYKSVTRRDNILTNLTENKVYVSKVLNKTDLKLDVVKPVIIDNKPKTEFVPIPIPSTPPDFKQQEPLITLGDAIHTKTKAKLKVLNKIDDSHYLVKAKNGYQVLCSKYISNFEPTQVAK